MSVVRFRNPEIRLSVALLGTASAVSGHRVTLRELMGLVGEQGLLVFCALLATPFLLPVTLPGMSVALGLPMFLIGSAVMLNRVVWLPDRLLDRELPADTVQSVLHRAAAAAARFEHLVKPRLLGLTGGPAINVVNGGLLVIDVLLLLAPLALVPFTNTLPGIAIVLLCLGMTERDGIVIVLGYVASLLAVAYVGGLMWLVFYAGMHTREILAMLRALLP